MSEVEQRVETYLVNYQCDSCGVGLMRDNGLMLPSNPPLYPHICDNSDCGDKKTFNQRYPYQNMKYI